ncbi:MAG: hypothetical protein H0V17_19225 [Deltaproteobacteria bacterium]|nr:hypothetical protein [Deltaproteobacteria bacterium]
MRFASYLLLGVSTVFVARVPAAAPTDGTVTGTVKFVRDGKDVKIPDGYVYLVPVRRGRPIPPKAVTTQIVQKNRRFIPDRLVIPVNSTVEFPNQEAPSQRGGDEHNVFSPSTPMFDLSRYGSGKMRSRKFLDEGEYDIYCDIHVQMTAKVKVVDSEHIVPVVNSRFSLAGVPAGKYKVFAWAPDSGESKETITVVAGETVTVPQLNVQLGQPTASHRRKNGGGYCEDKYADCNK